MFATTQASDARLRTERMELRPPGRRDLTALDAAIQESLADLVLWLPWARPGHSRTDSRAYIRHARLGWARSTALEFVMADLAGGRLLGMASLHRIDWARRSAGLGYWVRSGAQGNGLATEAGRALLTHAFASCRLHRIELLIGQENFPSKRVAEKLGFRREGIAREIEFVGGRYLDHIQYSLLNPEGAGRKA